VREKIPAGISIGVKKGFKELLGRIEDALLKGYQRIKLKIKPGWDVGPLKQVRSRFPSIALMVDANGAYRLEDMAHLKKLDEYDLMMIEQPLDWDDYVDHATLAKELSTPICLDESIRSPEDARRAIALGSCRIINVKQSRLGGLSNAIRLHEISREKGIALWCGGLLESGIGRAHNIALATLPGFTLPGDISASERYYHEDIIDPPVMLSRLGEIELTECPGIGYELLQERLKKYLLRSELL
jgi:O-succinylbenzoate synthase